MELLVVITIILLLAGMAVPSFSAFLLGIHQNQSQAIINMLDTGVKMYQADFSTGLANDPSALPPESYLPGWYGCQSIVQCLTGYLPALPTSTTIGGTTYTLPGDGLDGFGFRENIPGSTVKHGPYNGAEQIKTSTGDSAELYAIKDASTNHVGHPTFLDAFGKPIQYYVCVNGAYNLANFPPDNHEAWCGDPPGYYANKLVTASNGYSYEVVHEFMMAQVPIEFIRDTSLKLYRADYMLLSSGGDARWFWPGNRTSTGTWGSPPQNIYTYSSVKDDANNLGK